MEELSIPLFPLNTVLYPGGPLSLRIFEPRYLDMVSHCLKTDSAFGVCLIKQGTEAGRPAVPHRIGTLARIVDWDSLPEGLLGIKALGGDRFVVRATEIAPNKLLKAVVTLLPEPGSAALPGELDLLPRLLKELIDQTPQYASIQPRYDDPNWVGYRLAEILPLSPDIRQSLLEQDDPLARLRSIHSEIEIYLKNDANP